jgi:AraC family transcriptional regulator
MLTRSVGKFHGGSRIKDHMPTANNVPQVEDDRTGRELPVSAPQLKANGLLFGLLHGTAQTHLPAPPQQHVIYRLTTKQAGGLWERTNGSTVPFRKERGAITIAPVDMVPNMWLLAPATFVSCALDRALVNSVSEEMDTRPGTALAFKCGFFNSAIEALLQLLSNELHSGSPSGALYSESLAHALAVRFMLGDTGAQTSATYVESALPRHIMERVKDRIEGDLGQSLTLAALAAESGYSRAHFLRMFQSTVGQTPHQYVLARRIAQAQRMLKEKHYALADISIICGFSSQAHMTASFRKLLNTTPGHYRRTS